MLKTTVGLGMEIYITDSEIIASSLAKYLFGSDQSFDNAHIYCDSKVALVYTRGALFQLFNAKDYDTKFKRWDLDVLPVIPKNFQFKPKPNKQSFIEEIASHIKTGTRIYNCATIGEKTQFDIDLLIRNLSFNGDIFRILISDPTSDGVKRAFSKTNSNKDYRSISASGYCRYIADWLLGVNFTILYTNLAKKAGYHSLIHIGRVQTSIFSIINKRYIDASLGKNHDYFTSGSLLKYLQEHTSSFFYLNGINISGIIHKLIATGFIQSTDSKLVSTSLGKSIYNALPLFFKSTEITTQWEEKLKSVSNGSLNQNEFIEEISRWVADEVNTLIASNPVLRIDENDIHRCKCNTPLIKKFGKFGTYWECTNQACKKTFSNKNNAPIFKIEKNSEHCPQCKVGLLKKTVLPENKELQLKQDTVISCDQYPKCNYINRNSNE